MVKLVQRLNEQKCAVVLKSGRPCSLNVAISLVAWKVMLAMLCFGDACE